MAGGMDLGNSGKGGKKSLDTAINLVPFIDLMAVTISFLIMTAVWNQIGKLTVTQTGGSTSSDSAPPPQINTRPITLTVTETGFSLSDGGSMKQIEKVNSRYVICHAANDVIDTKCEEGSLVAELKRIKTEVPDQRNITVQVEDKIKYEDLIKVIDVCNMKDGENYTLFPDVAVSALG